MDRLLSLLLHLYPDSFRTRFGQDVLAHLRRDLREARARGRSGAASRTVRLLVSFAASGLAERVAAGRRSAGVLGGTMMTGGRHALRELMRHPGSTATSVGMLALGVAVNVSVFSMAMGALAPRIGGVAGADRLVSLFQYSTEHGYHSSLSLPTYLDYRDGLQTVGDLAAYSGTPVNLVRAGGSERIAAQMVSRNFFRVLGIDPVAGRGFLEAGAAADDRRSAIVAYDAWVRELGARPDIVGSTLRLNAEPFTVVGVAPAGFRGLDLEAPADVWVPLDARDAVMTIPETWIQGRGMHWLSTVGRLRPGATPQEAADEARALAGVLARTYPDVQDGWEARVLPLTEAVLWPELRDTVRRAAVMLGTVVVLLLLLACVTLASMALADAMRRRGEAAVRLALGARRAHLVGGQAAQALLITVPGLILGLVAGGLVTRLTMSMGLIPRLPPGLDLSPDGRLVIASLVVVPLLTFLVGTLPALHLVRSDPSTALENRSGGEGRRTSRIRRVLSSVQVGISVVVLTIAGTLTLGAHAQLSRELGFKPGQVLLASVDPQLSGYDEEARALFYERARARLEEAVPGVSSVAVAAFVPFTGPKLGDDVRYTDAQGIRRTLNVTGNIVSADYFRTMGVSLSRGRDLDAEPVAGPVPIVVSEGTARRFWGDADPLGRTLDLGEYLGGEATVVGVSGNLATGRSAGRPAIYVPLWAKPWGSATFHLRLQTGDPARAGDDVRRVLGTMDPGMPVYEVRALAGVVESARMPAVAAAGAVGLLGTLGLLLAGAGIYGVVAQAVARRRQELGVRMAVGATHVAVVRDVLGEGGLVFLGGLFLGIPGTFLVARFLRGGVLGMQGLSPAALTVAVLLTGLATVLALVVPARRASRVDPAEALRSS